jgi:hypothetical protein
LNPFHEEQLVAQVGDRRLYVSDVTAVFKAGLTPEDSLKLLDQYVDAWVMRQLKVEQAEKLFTAAEPEIEQMVEDYRTSLLTHKLDQYHVDVKADTTLTESEIGEYYNTHRGDFILDRTIVKGVTVKLPAKHARKAQVKELMTGTGERYQDFLELSRKNGFEVTEVDTWMDFSDFLRRLPTNSLRNYDELLDRTGVQEMADGGDLYLVLIRSSLRRGAEAPIERVSEDIRRVVMNQRRQEIIRAYEDSIRTAAITDGKLRINE